MRKKSMYSIYLRKKNTNIVLRPIDSTFVALYDYEAEESGELTILKDQVLYVFTERGGWFYGRNDSGQVGLFPSNYVESTGTQ